MDKLIVPHWRYKPRPPCPICGKPTKRCYRTYCSHKCRGIARAKPAERLWSMFHITPNGCLEFTGQKNPNGYGQLSINGKRKLAHVLAYEMVIGPIPTGHGVLHHCDNPPCINPTCLFTGTQADNMKDMQAKGRNHRKLTDKQIQAIFNDPRRNYILAAEYDVSRTLIGYIKKSQIHKRLTSY